VISVLLRSTPLKISIHRPDPVLSAKSFSSWVVRTMLATCSCARSSIALPPSRLRDFSASCSLPFRTSHQGDSGARKDRMISCSVSYVPLNQVATCRNWPNPLGRIRDPPGPVVGNGLGTVDDSTRHETTCTSDMFKLYPRDDIPMFQQILT
jgi:hypothetical protein